MAVNQLPEDPLWQRASAWIAPSSEPPTDGLAILGVPASASSITPTQAHTTPWAIREALARYSTYAEEREVDLSALRAVDIGDVEDPDGPDGEQRTASAARRAASADLLVALGGDNSITAPLVKGLFGESLAQCGLITIDAHHDLREGRTNGSPVRRILDAGLPGRHAVQIGIADFANSAAYAAYAREREITVISRSEVLARDTTNVAEQALEVASRGGGPVFVDVDVDVCDRSVAPACPSSVPGGLSAHELRQLVYRLTLDPRVRGMDITEIDATADAPDQRTVRLAALLVLEAAAGLCSRGLPGSR